MEALHPKAKGNVGELKVAAHLADLGYAVFTELGDLSRVDLIAERSDGRLIKVQVKCRKSKNGTVVIDRNKAGPGYRFRYGRDDVDVFAVYVYDYAEVFFVSSSLVCSMKAGPHFRLVPTRNGQEKGVRYVSDYSDFEAAVKDGTPP